MDDFSRLITELKRRLNATLLSDVANAIKETESKHVRQDVYALYTPGMYHRRMYEGGLSDTKNMIVETGDLEVSVDNRTPFNNAYDNQNPSLFVPPPNSGDTLAELIEYGDGGGGHIYNYPYPNDTGDFLQPRPFIESTVNELTAGKLKAAMTRGLRRRGVVVD